MSTPYSYIVNPSVVIPGIYANGVWTATLPQAIYHRDLLRLSLQGPPSSQVKCYQGFVAPENLFDTTTRGDANTADYSGGPVSVQAGNTVTIQWSPYGTGTFTGTETVSATFTVRQA